MEQRRVIHKNTFSITLIMCSCLSNNDKLNLLTSGNVVDTIEIASSFLVEHILSLTTDDLKRIRLVEQLARFAD